MVNRIEANRVAQPRGATGKVMADSIPDVGDEEVVGEPDGHDAIEYRRMITHEWIDGLMQRISCALDSNTPLTVCPRDYEVLNFVMLALNCVDIDGVLELIERSKAEQLPKEE